jgi:hypothetical protein
MKAFIKDVNDLDLSSEEIKYKEYPNFRRKCYIKWLKSVKGLTLEVRVQYDNGNCIVVCPLSGYSYDVKKEHIQIII